MKAIKTMDMTLPFALKQEEEINEDEIDDDASLNELDKILSMPLPSINESNLLLPSTSNHEFLRLTAMACVYLKQVRAVYFSYLHKCLLSNYIVCYEQKNEETFSCDLKKCADQMELNAVRCSIEASLYRQHMLKMISDIKSHTSQKKIYKQIVMFLETPPNKVDVGVQTNNLCLKSNRCDQHKSNTTQDACITSNYEELINLKETLFVDKKVAGVEESNLTLIQDDANVKTILLKEEDVQKLIFEEQNQETTILIQTLSSGTPIQQPVETVQNDENSQDSLLQHMEDMFCESEDSSDLTTLIEKHSRVSKASVDKGINKTSLNTGSSITPNLKEQTEENSDIPKSNVKMSNPVQAKCSFSCYKEMKNRTEKPTEINKEETIESKEETVECKQETSENKQKKKTDSIWFVERVHQVSKLKTKMTDLSLTNYRKHGKVKEKFIELFGEFDEEEMMPDSPICIEEHLTACKERIAPWIVKYLMPFYKKRRIKDRQLFKAVAKHIADMLIIENTFPEESCINKYIENYFRNRKFIRTSQDIYM
ncbi:chromatin-remodeling ATPase INO80 [Vespula squamosa]|uniref:Chromatin-remodeling ATPase INO80 n=1 Tax=Vespula squamosa TaxID=30214 RepID=A0ABD2AUV4_VESSQ